MSNCICKGGWINTACPVDGVPSSGDDPLTTSEQRQKQGTDER